MIWEVWTERRCEPTAADALNMIALIKFKTQNRIVRESRQQ